MDISNLYLCTNLNNFYRKIKFSRFQKLTIERCNEINELVNKWWEYFHNQPSLLKTINILIEKLITAPRRFNLNNGDEIYYFYIKMLDPSLVLLEIYESANKREEIKQLALINFPFFDRNLLKLERMLNNQLKFYNSQDLWSRDSIRH